VSRFYELTLTGIEAEDMLYKLNIIENTILELQSSSKEE
jgi:hypothetical protein